MEPATVGRIDRKSSIESEPRTLGVDQIQFAREVAQYVVNTSIDEAQTIFTAGLKPVMSVRSANEFIAGLKPVMSVRSANEVMAMNSNEEYFEHEKSKLQ